MSQPQQIGSRKSRSTLVDLLRERASTQGDATAFTFLRNGEDEQDIWSFAALDARARAIAARLQSSHRPGDRVLLLYSPGLEFVAAFFGCLYAGAIAVPLYPPRRNHHLHRLQAVLKDADAAIALTTQDVMAQISPWLAKVPALQGIQWYRTDEFGVGDGALWQPPDLSGDTLAFLQYTSGSTGHPKGVMVSHENLLYCSADQALTWEYSPESVNVTWLPVFHDLGLIYGILQPIYQGIPSYVMAPVAFLQRPVRWLQAISRYRGTHTAAPNFAYELCVQKIGEDERSQLDLRCWKMAMNGAEPVRPTTLAKFSEAFGDCGFDANVHCPAYGLAEATLKVTAIAKSENPVSLTVDAGELSRDRVVPCNPNTTDSLTLASCGRPVLETEIAIVHPDTHSQLPPYEVGEIWVDSPLVAQGYWNNPEATEATFNAKLSDGGDREFLRTGDLGFLDDTGALFVTGRLKDLMIIDGANYYPQDIEATVESCHPGLRLGAGAAFAVDVNGRERLVVAQELERTYLRHPELDSIIIAVRQAIAQNHDLPVHAVLLLRTASIPKTSSGKIQRQACRQGFLNRTLNIVREWSYDPRDRTSFLQLSSDIEAVTKKLQEPPEPPKSDRQLSASEVETWLKQKLARQLDIALEDIDTQQSLAYHGLTSQGAIALLAELETKFSRSLTPTVLWNYPTIAGLSCHIAGEETVEESTPTVHPTPSQPARSPSTDTDAIAIIGMGCRFPGASSPEEFWDLVKQGKDAIGEVPRDRWDRDRFPRDKKGVHQGGFIDGVDRFDPEFFGISHHEATRMDPQQRLLMEVTWNALEHAGIRPDSLVGSETGVFVGVASQDYGWLQLENFDNIDAYAGTGNAYSITANRLSYWLDLRGPSMAIDTACSASLLAVHTAAQNLRLQECDLAIAGGVNLILNPRLNLAFSDAGMMASDGRCKTFDARADGYVRSEGCGLVILKRLSDAQRDGDRILAVLRGTATNQDGRSNGLTAPNGMSQRDAVRKALDRAGVEPHEIGYVQAHGTGTSLGDPIELSALKAVLNTGRSPQDTCWIASVKANIGHLEAAAGIAGLIQTVLVLQHGEIPAQPHFQKLNPLIDLEGTPFKISTQHQPWVARTPRRLAGVSSFSFGGSNVHVIVEEAPVRLSWCAFPSAVRRRGVAPPIDPPRPTRDRPLHLLTLSAHRREALTELAFKMRSHLQTAPEKEFADICYTANAHRTTFRHRLAIVAATPEQMRERLTQYLQGEKPSGVYSGHEPPSRAPIAFVFPGTCPVSPAVGRQLYETSPLFREVFDACDDIVNPLLGRSIAEVLDDEVLIEPAVFAIEYALARLWQSWGLRLDWLVGQGVGEYVAACLAGVFSLEDGLKLAVAKHRGLEEFDLVANNLSYQAPKQAIVSPRTGQVVTDAIATPDYWKQQVREPSDTISTAAIPEETLFIEMGSNSSDRPSYFPSLRSSQTPWETLLESLAKLTVRGVEIDWDAFDRPYSRRLVTLPNYPFQRRRCWFGEDNLEENSQQSTEIVSDSWFQHLDRASRSDRHPLLVRLLQAEFARVLGRSSPEDIEPTRGFFEMGFDSLSMVTLRSRLEREIGHPLSATLGFNYPTLESLADYLLQAILHLESDRPKIAVSEALPETPQNHSLGARSLAEGLCAEPASAPCKPRPCDGAGSHRKTESPPTTLTFEDIQELSETEAETRLLEKLQNLELS
ncbi:beta-ketoacyl synthase N-terminal-like domain-containing protein [Geitlerinema sp. CS-897]|nr:beta-ketoacyl synthase N-terminal-like domain-containing protein [Geitlerinema sp. CS-897]